MRSFFLVVSLTLFGEAWQALLTNYVAEVYFVIDQKVVENYMRESNVTTIYGKKQQAINSIKADVNYFLAEVNKLYSSLAVFGLNIEIRSRQLDILDNNIWSGGSVISVGYGLEEFDNWLLEQGSQQKLGYDVTVLWSGFDLVSSSSGGDGGTAGYAHLAGVCSRRRSSAIVEFDGTYHTVVVTAHEIGHVLGANHDMFDQGYIMAPSSSASSSNRWKFTSSSAEEIERTLGRLYSTNCLLVTNPSTVALSGPLTPALKDPDVICQRTMESLDSFMCKSPSMYGYSVPQGDAVCSAIYCQNPDKESTCQTAFSSDGLTCGVNKVCRGGACQYDANAGTGDINADCIWGDIKVFKITVNDIPFKGSCADFIQTYGSRMCTQTSVSRSCCETCNVPKGSSVAASDCPYGDQPLRLIVNGESFSGSCALFTATYGQYMCEHDYIKESCCQTCANRRRSRSNSPALSGSLWLRPRMRLYGRFSDFLGLFFRSKRAAGDKIEILPVVLEEVKYSTTNA